MQIIPASSDHADTIHVVQLLCYMQASVSAEDCDERTMMSNFSVVPACVLLLI